MSEACVHSRPVLPDRLRLVVSPKFMEASKDSRLEEFFRLGMQWAKENKVRVRRYYKNGEQRINIDLPDRFFPEYVKHVSVSLKCPYSVSMEFNFIRFLKYVIKNSDTHSKNYRQDYEDLVLLEDDNFINYEQWSNWDSSLVSKLLKEGIFKVALKVAKIANSVIVESGGEEVENFCIVNYCNVTVKQAEFNVDFYVGNNLSAIAIDRFPTFFYSIDGREWRKKCGEISFQHYAPKGNCDLDITSKNGVAGHSFRFSITKGLFFKVYRKTRDHIRGELVMSKSFIVSRFKGSCGVTRLMRPMLEFSKDFFKEVCFEDTLECLMNDKQVVGMVCQLSPLYDFIRGWKPALLDVCSSVLLGSPIIEKDAICMIRADSALRDLFVRSLNENGKYVYSYNPKAAHVQKMQRCAKIKKSQESEDLKMLRILGLKDRWYKVNESDVRSPTKNSPRAIRYDQDGVFYKN